MRGAFVIATLVALAAAPAAVGAPPTALMTAGRLEADGAGLAVAGDAVLIGRWDGRVARVLRLPVGGGTPATILRFTAPPGARAGDVRLDASATTAAAVVTTGDDETDLAAAQPFAGPAAGPLEAIGPLTELGATTYFTPFVAVDGERLIRDEYRGDFRRHRTIVADPGAPPAAVRLPQSAFIADVAGELVAYADSPRGDDDEPRRLVVAAWRTGERRWTKDIPGRIESLDLRADGRVLAGEDGSGVVEVAAGGASVRRISRRGTLPRYAGDAVVFLDQRESDARLFVAAADRRPHPFGVVSAAIDDVAAGERSVAWRAHGCVLAAPIGAGAARAPAPGPCARSEATVVDRIPAVRADGRFGVLVRCLAAPPGGCRGWFRLRTDGNGARGVVVGPRRRFRVPVGSRRRVVVRATRRGAAAMRRDRIGDQAILFVEGVLVDPDGRRSRFDGFQNVVIPPRR